MLVVHYVKGLQTILKRLDAPREDELADDLQLLLEWAEEQLED